MTFLIKIHVRLFQQDSKVKLKARPAITYSGEPMYLLTINESNRSIEAEFPTVAMK